MVNLGWAEPRSTALFDGLRATRSELTSEEWKAFIVSEALTHQVREMVHQDPCTRRGFQKPRSYPGDAVLLDHIYDEAHEHRQAAETDLGREIENITTRGAACRAVRFRRQYLAALIDEMAASSPNARVLSVAAGHFQEGQFSKAVQNSALGEVIAFDQDAESVDYVRQRFSARQIVTVRGTVRDLIAGKVEFANLNLAYAAGLFDYVSTPVARRLAEVMFESITNGGTLVIANFTPSVPDLGYMEAYMDWHLTYRTSGQLMEVLENLPRHQVQQMVFSHDPDHAIAFCRVTKSY